MAGHSKWANIKHRKAKADAAKGKMFSRVTKEIISSIHQTRQQMIRTLPGAG